MISLGFGKFARSDRIYALEPLLGEERGDGRRTKVWIDGITDPVIASRTQGTILRDMVRTQLRMRPWSMRPWTWRRGWLPLRTLEG